MLLGLDIALGRKSVKVRFVGAAAVGTGPEALKGLAGPGLD